jgi:hypothetical protein
MTVMDVRPAVVPAEGLVSPRLAAALARIPVCTAARHAATEYAYSEGGCRCPGARTAHRAHLDRRRGRTRMQDPKVDEQGNCVAERHGPSEYAYRQGCRCPGSVAAYEAMRERDREIARAKHAEKAEREQAAADPREHWRGPDMRVNRTNLVLLLSGFVDRPTRGERIAAVHRLARTGNRFGTGLNDNVEIAARIGVSRETVRTLKAEIEGLRINRTQRRLADVRWRARRAAR